MVLITTLDLKFYVIFLSKCYFILFYLSVLHYKDYSYKLKMCYCYFLFLRLIYQYVMMINFLIKKSVKFIFLSGVIVIFIHCSSKTDMHWVKYIWSTTQGNIKITTQEKENRFSKQKCLKCFWIQFQRKI